MEQHSGAGSVDSPLWVWAAPRDVEVPGVCGGTHLLPGRAARGRRGVEHPGQGLQTRQREVDLTAGEERAGERRCGRFRAWTRHSATERGRGQGGWPRGVSPLQPHCPQATDLCSARQAVASAVLRCRSCGCPWHRASRSSCTWWVRYSAMKPMKSLAGLGEGWT